MGNFIAWLIGLFVNNPMVIAGICLASYYKFKYLPSVIKAIFTQAWVPYAIIGGIGVLYAVLVKHIHYPNGKINWKATISSSFIHILTIAFSMVLTFVVLYAWDYAFMQDLDNYLRYKK